MKLIHKDIIGFSCLILIVIVGGLYLLDSQLKIITISENSDMLDEDVLQKLIQRQMIESYFGVAAMMIFMMCVIAMIMTFSRSPMLSNIKSIKNATDKISKGDFDTRIMIKGDHDEITDLCNNINEMTLKLKEDIAIKSNLKQALDISADVAVTDKNGIIKYVNEEFCKTSKYSKEELIGNNHNMLKSGLHPDSFYKNMWNTINSGQIWSSQIQNRAKDGTLYWNDIVIMPFLDYDKKIQEFVSIRRDITNQINLQNEKTKNEKMVLVGQLSSRLAHDIRNPLSIIQVALENLKLKYGTYGSSEQSFDRVTRSIDRITHQIDDVLHFVKGRPPKISKVKSSEIINDSLDSITVPENIKLILPKNDVELFCDKEQCVIVMNNLILNAIQAIDGTGTIEISLEENKDEIAIQVKDSGQGIPKENLDKIFEPLFTTKQIGTGLGLVSVKAIVEAHGGTISVTSPPTVFTITLPKISN